MMLLNMREIHRWSTCDTLWWKIYWSFLFWTIYGECWYFSGYSAEHCFA